MLCIPGMHNKLELRPTCLPPLSSSYQIQSFSLARQSNTRIDKIFLRYAPLAPPPFCPPLLPLPVT